MWNLMTLDGFFDGAENWALDWHQYAWGEELERMSIEQLRVADMLLFGGSLMKEWRRIGRTRRTKWLRT